jgi:hypothetical protein
MDATGQNMCEFNPTALPARWQVFYAAMNEADWDRYGGKSAICGRCLAVRGVQGSVAAGFQIKTVYVKIVDQCPSWACKQGNVDFSIAALDAITGYEWDKKAITWDFAPCPSGSSNPTWDYSDSDSTPSPSKRSWTPKPTPASKISSGGGDLSGSRSASRSTAVRKASRASRKAVRP